MIHNYINLTNGIEAIPKIKNLCDGNYKFIRIQSTYCEQHLWDRIIQDLDYDLLMNLALGDICFVYDFGANKPKPRAAYQGIEFIKYVLYKHWLHKEYETRINRSYGIERGHNCNKYFSQCYERLDKRTKKKLDYFIPYLNTEDILLCPITNDTEHDGDRSFYRNLLMTERM